MGNSSLHHCCQDEGTETLHVDIVYAEGPSAAEKASSASNDEGLNDAASRQHGDVGMASMAEVSPAVAAPLPCLLGGQRSPGAEASCPVQGAAFASLSKLSPPPPKTLQLQLRRRAVLTSSVVLQQSPARPAVPSPTSFRGSTSAGPILGAIPGQTALEGGGGDLSRSYARGVPPCGDIGSSSQAAVKPEEALCDRQAPQLTQPGVPLLSARGGGIGDLTYTTIPVVMTWED